MHLYVGTLTRDQKHRLEKASAFLFGLYWKKTLNDLWYDNPDKMREILGADSWRDIYAGDQRYRGPVLGDRGNLAAFMDATGIYLDEREVKFRPGRITRRFKGPKAPPRLTGENVAVCHGEHYEGYTTYAGRIETPFTEKQLCLTFADCGENGFILDRVAYAGKGMTRSDQVPEKEKLKLRFIQQAD